MKCDNCEKPATVNVQKVWIKWEYDDKSQTYSDKNKLLSGIEEPTGNENLHFCDKCFNLWWEPIYQSGNSICKFYLDV